MSALIAYITTRDGEEALRIGRDLVESRLAACINVLPGMQSIYWWQGKVEEAQECVLLLKTSEHNSQAVIKRVKELHSYACPCVVFWPLTEGNPDYLRWIEKESNGA